MPKPLSQNTPPALARVFAERQIKNATELAIKAGLEPDTVYSHIYDGTKRGLRTANKIARALGITLEQIYTIDTMPDITLRKARLLDLMNLAGINDLQELANICGLSRSHISLFINGKKSFAGIETSRRIGLALGLDLDEFHHVFEQS